MREICIKKCSKEMIQTYFDDNKSVFVPPLESRVNIDDYAEKIADSLKFLFLFIESS